MVIIYLLLFIVTTLYLWLKFVYSYWARKGFPYIKPSIPFGNISNTWFGKRSIGMNLYDLYLHSKKPVEGVYFLFRPALIFRDPSLIKNILTTDYASFYDRGLYYTPNDPVGCNMFMMYGQDWKSLRSKLSPTFTSGKLKGMMPTIIQIADNLQRKLSNVAENNEVIDIKDLTIRFGMDVIGTVGFGLDVNSIDNPDHSFREIEKQINSGAFLNRLRLIGGFFCPKILEALNMSSTPAKFQNYMVDIVRSTMEHRKKSQTMRKDFIQLLLELQNTGKIADGDSFGEEHSTNTESSIKYLTVEECAGQVALFYLAGFDTTASTVAYTIFELSRKPELQKRLQDEIDSTLAKYDNSTTYSNSITYENIKEMNFLDSCVNETLRKYPTLPFLNRFCTKDYPIEDLNLTVPKGTPIVISLLGLMRDPDNFPDPNNYLPDRFSLENPMYNPDAYLPFGDGPKVCIGSRMGKITTKIALIKLLQSYDFRCVDDRELTVANHSLTIVIQGGIQVTVSKRQF